MQNKVKSRFLLLGAVSFCGVLAMSSFVMNKAQAQAPAPAPAPAPADGVACYRIVSSDTPNGDEISEQNPDSLRHETWCYRPLANPSGATFIYNADDTLARPELSAIVERDGTITHASLLDGEITVHRLKGNYNPMPFPLTPPTGAERVAVSEQRRLGSAAVGSLSYLLNEPASNEDISVRSDGNFSAMVKATVVPWRGYWWSYAGQHMYSGASSPLAKYDRFVRARTGENPGARLWESKNHKPNGLKWSGHCNGWAAAAIMRRQPRSSVRDPVSGVTFSVADLKGILSEKDKCIKLAFFGKRYNGKAGDDLKDIYPGEFHNTLTYYIGQLKKPVAIDYMQGRGIENNVVSSYTMDMKRTSPGVFTVAATLRIHKYDSARSNAPGPAPAHRKTYRYKIWVNSDGQITEGVWLTKNPDFLWVPLGPNQCSTANPKVTEDWVEKIMAL